MRQSLSESRQIRPRTFWSFPAVEQSIHTLAEYCQMAAAGPIALEHLEALRVRSGLTAGLFKHVLEKFARLRELVQGGQVVANFRECVVGELLLTQTPVCFGLMNASLIGGVQIEMELLRQADREFARALDP